MAKKRIPKKIGKVVRGYVQRLEKEDNLIVKDVFVFGSQAKGETREWSDIDVCVISPEFENYLKALKYLWVKRKDAEVRQGLEPIGFSEKEFNEGSALIEEIKRTGVKLSVK